MGCTYERKHLAGTDCVGCTCDRKQFRLCNCIFSSTVRISVFERSPVTHDLILPSVCARRAYPRRFLGRVGRTPYRPRSLGDGSKCRRGKGLKTVCLGARCTSALFACYPWFWVYPQVATITLDFCMHSLHNLTMCLFLCMTVIVNNGTEHVEQKRRASCGNKISCGCCSMVGAKAAPPPCISDCNREELF